MHTQILVINIVDYITYIRSHMYTFPHIAAKRFSSSYYIGYVRRKANTCTTLNAIKWNKWYHKRHRGNWFCRRVWVTSFCVNVSSTWSFWDFFSSNVSQPSENDQLHKTAMTPTSAHSYRKVFCWMCFRGGE